MPEVSEPIAEGRYEVSVVVPTRNRPDLLAGCLDAVRASIAAAEVVAEIVVVDDGSDPPVVLDGAHDVRVIRGSGEGPARARNRGIAAASADIIAFTDDDARVSVAWIGEALGALRIGPGVVGARGPVVSPPFDPLYEYSVEDLNAGRFLTCNVAYRRRALEEVGGFDPSFRRAHEDIDLGLRISALGEVAFVPEMVVTHPGRAFSATEWDRRASFISDDWLFFRRYPTFRRSSGSVAVAPLRILTRRWLKMALDREHGATSVVRMRRWVRLATGQLARVVVITASSWRAHAQRPVEARSGLRLSGLRVAYVGPVPSRKVSGAPGVEGWILASLAEAGCSIDCYVPTSAHFEAVDDIAGIEGVRVIEARSRFRFGRWYSKVPLTKMVSYQAAAALSRRRLAGVLLAEHEAAAYDVIYQCSSIESFGLPRRRAGLAPVVLHPSVHAAGELRWLRAERALAAQCGGIARARLVEAWMALRAQRQRRDINKATRVLALSSVFGHHLIEDYGVDPARVSVVANVIDVEAFASSAEPLSPRDAPLEVATIVVLGRVVVRKGIPDIIALSHRLEDLAGAVRIVVVGEGSLWSDYTPLLKDLAPQIASWEGRMERGTVIELLGSSRLLIQASRYEPFGLTVGEALACGVPVVATSEVGATEGLDPSVCTVVEPGDVDALEAAVRAELAKGPLDGARREACRAEVVRLYAPWVIGPQVLAELTAVAAG